METCLVLASAQPYFMELKLGYQQPPDLQRLRKNERAMIRWIYVVKPHDEVPMETLYTELGIQEVMTPMHLSGQSQLPVSPSLALEDVGDQESLRVSVLKWMLMCAT